MKRIAIVIMALLALAGSASAQTGNSIFVNNVTAQGGQEVTLPIMINNTSDITVVGISFTLSLPQGVTLVTDEEGEPAYELVSSRLNPKRFTVYSSQDENGAWGFRIAATTTTAVLAGNSGAALTLPLAIATGTADGNYTISLTGNKLSVRDSNNSVSTLQLEDTESVLTIGDAQKKGDVNGDGNIDVADIMTIINVMNRSTVVPAADVNGDGRIDVSDIATVISLMIGMAQA